MCSWSSGEWFRPILALFGFHVYVSHLKCDIINTITQMKAIFITFTSNEIFLWSFVAIDYNHVEFSLILTQGTYINSLFWEKNERNFILILIYYIEDIITFTKITNLCISYYGFLIFWARHLILGVIFGKVHLGGVYVKLLFEKTFYWES